MEKITGLVASVSPAVWCQLGFTAATCTVLVVAAAPAAERKLMLTYGARGSPAGDGKQRTESPSNGLLLKLTKRITSLTQVPHSWFTSFYAVYLLCAAFWAVEYLQDGRVLRSISRRQQETVAPAMTPGQVVLVWFLMVLQATRRLYECLAIIKPSKSKMWIVHWLLGLAFYSGISVAVWIEGGSSALPYQLGMSTSKAVTPGLGLKITIGVPMFFYGWTMQHRCHKYLAGLEKYSLPDSGLFRNLICPHYTCECLLYFSLAIVAAPDGQLCNRSLLSAFVFVVANLGVTAQGTKAWYMEKFGSEKVSGKRIMIPFIF